MFRDLLRTTSTLVTAILFLGCGGASDDNGLCTTLGPDNPNWRGCSNALFDLDVHPCERQVADACATAGSIDVCRSEQMPQCATNYYLRNYAPEQLRSCNPEKPVLPIDAELKLSLYRYSNIGDASVVLHTQGLQRFYEPYELTMTTDTMAVADRIRYALSGSELEITQALSAAGISPTATSLTPQQEELATRVIGDVMFAPTKAFLRAHAVPIEPKVNIVVIDQIASPGFIELSDLDGVIVGLGLSSTLIRRLQETDPDAASLNTMLQVDGDFTPTLFVGHNDLALLADDFDFVIAHELGHALGLAHVEQAGNLMEQGDPGPCQQWLSQDQIESMGPFADTLNRFDGKTRSLLSSPRKILGKLMAKRRSKLSFP